MLIYDCVREKILKGMEKCIKMVSKTFGPNGSYVIIDSLEQKITKDGYTVISEITLDDKIENFGATLLKSCAEKTYSDASDGTTSTTILTYEMCKAVLQEKELTKKEIFETIDKFKVDLMNQLELHSFEIKTNELPYLIKSSCNDLNLINIIKEIVQITKNDKLIIYKVSDKDKIYFEKTDGLVLQKSAVSKLYLNNGKLFMNNPYVILYNGKINNIHELESIIIDIKKENILICSEGFNKEVIDYTLHLNNIYTNKIICVINPFYGNNKDDELLDVAIYLNTNIITSKTKDISKIISKVDSVEIYSDKTVIKNKINSDKINERINYLKENVKQNSKRISMLSESIINVYIPLNDYEYEITKDNLRNGINTTIKGLNSKVIYGAGKTLKEISNQMIAPNKLYSRLINTLKIIDEIINTDELVYDSLLNMKVIIENSINIVKIFSTIDGYIKTSKKISVQYDGL